MKSMQTFPGGVVATTVLLGLIACSDMATSEKDTTAGAAVGGVIGKQVGKDKK